MTPDDERRRIDGLLASYGEMRATLERLDERSSGQGEEIDGVRDALRMAMSHTEKMLAAIGVECDKNSARVEKKVDAQSKRIDRLSDKLDALAAARSWTPTQWAAILGPAIAGLSGAAAIVLSKGSP